MIYSVFNQDAAQYDYFRADGPRFGERAPAIRGGTQRVGTHVESVLPQLPPGAVRVGAGGQARGILASGLQGFGQNAPDEPTQWTYFGLYLVGGLLAVGLILKAVRKL